MAKRSSENFRAGQAAASSGVTSIEPLIAISMLCAGRCGHWMFGEAGFPVYHQSHVSFREMSPWTTLYPMCGREANCDSPDSCEPESVYPVAIPLGALRNCNANLQKFHLARF